MYFRGGVSIDKVFAPIGSRLAPAMKENEDLFDFVLFWDEDNVLVFVNNVIDATGCHSGVGF